MAQVVGYEIEVQVGGAWRTVQSFGPSEHGNARVELARLESAPPGGGLKLIEETVDDSGVFKRRTLVFKRFDEEGAPAGGKDAIRRGAGGTTAAPKSARAKDRQKSKPAGTGRDARASTGKAAQAKGRKAGLGGLTDLLSFLFIPIRARTVDGEDGVSTVSAPPVPAPTELRGEVPIFEDERETPQEDLVVIDATYRQFHSFFEAIENSGMLTEARRDPEFSRRISLFAIGVLFSIE